jgi:hypothetical protein
MRTDEDLDALLRDTDPVHTEALPDPDGPAALRIRTQARQRSRRGRMRRLVVIPTAAALALGGATAGAMTLFGDGHTTDSMGVECVHPSGARAELGGLNAAEIVPAEACREFWEGSAAGSVPGPLTECAPSDGRGGVRVYAGGPEVCEQQGEIPYAGPSDEQQRFALFRAEAHDRFDALDCPSRPEALAVIDELLDEYELTRWTRTESGPEDVRAETWDFWEDGECFVGLSYVEQDREILITFTDFLT